MASVNNSPNLKPLINAQSAEQGIDFEFLKKETFDLKHLAANSESKLARALLDLGIINSSVVNAKNNMLNDSQVKTELLSAATNAARDLVISQLSSKFDESADFDVFNPKVLNSMGIFADLPSVSVQSDVMERVYSRSGSGALTYLRVNDRVVLDIFVDGVKVLDKQHNGNQSFHDVIPDSIPYLKYRNSIEIYAKTAPYSLVFKDWKTT